ncbi:MAG TPA: hypothetical protein DCY20_02320 [Firmicutes bacterium]|nr:hypothetical protein [Bacillota bacterium]
MGSLAYTQEEAFAKAMEQMGLIGITDSLSDGEESEPNQVINNEYCYFANTEFMTSEGMPRVNQIYIGSISLNVYSVNGDYMLTLE